jgi:hypothetical protein
MSRPSASPRQRQDHASDAVPRARLAGRGLPADLTARKQARKGTIGTMGMGKLSFVFNDFTHSTLSTFL